MKISIIGSGIVGQATGMGLASKENHVKFYDIDRAKLLSLASKGYDVTENLDDAVNDAKILFVCVPTPTVEKKIDLRHIQECTKMIGKALEESGKYTVVAYRSTIPPHTTRTKLIPLLESYSGLKSGINFGVSMNPEFLREISPLKDFLNPTRVVIGALDDKSAASLKGVYSNFKCPQIITDLDTAEMIKYTSNIFLAAKISFFNEMFMICKGLGIDPKVVSRAVSLDPRIGDYGTDGGRPFGGMCLPKDLYAFLEFARLKGLSPVVLPAVAKVNEDMCEYHATQEIEVRLQKPCLP